MAKMNYSNFREPGFDDELLYELPQKPAHKTESLSPQEIEAEIDSIFKKRDILMDMVSHTRDSRLRNELFEKINKCGDRLVKLTGMLPGIKGS